jgi:hypothetical protein
MTLFAQLDGEMALTARMRQHDVPDPFAGVTTTADRAEIMRQAILSCGLERVICCTDAKGKAETYAECFERIYAQELVPAAKRKRKAAL